MTTKDKALQLLDLLLAEYPAAFSNDKEKVRPLEIDVHQALYPWAKQKGYSGTALRKALALYCGRSAYLNVLSGRKPRVNLAGEPVGEVSKEQATFARQRLQVRKKAKPPTGTLAFAGTPPKRPLRKGGLGLNFTMFFQRQGGILPCSRKDKAATRLGSRKAPKINGQSCGNCCAPMPRRWWKKRSSWL